MASFRFSGQGFTFRPLEEKDLEWARLLHNDQEVRLMLTDPRSVSRKAQREWFESIRESHQSQRLVVRRDKKRIGIVRLDSIDRLNRSVLVGLDIGRRHRGRHYAKRIYSALLGYLFSRLGMHRAWLKVAEFNPKARRLYRELGFREEGVEREALYRFKKFHGYVVMGLLAREWKSNGVVSSS